MRNSAIGFLLVMAVTSAVYGMVTPATFAADKYMLLAIALLIVAKLVQDYDFD